MIFGWILMDLGWIRKNETYIYVDLALIYANIS